MEKTWVSTITILISAMCILFLTINEIRGEGIAFSNLDDIYYAWRYLRCIEKKDYEAAVKYISFELTEYKWFEGTSAMSDDEFEQYMKNRLLEEMKEYEQLGLYINNVRFRDVYRHSSGWDVKFSITENYPDGSEKKYFPSFSRLSFYPFIVKSPLSQSGSSYYPDGRIVFFHSISHVNLVDDYYDEYAHLETSFVLEEGEKAVITWGNIDMPPSDYLNVYIKHKGAEVSMNVQKFYSSGKSIEAVVPGEYSLTASNREYDERPLKEGEFYIEIQNYE